MYEKNYASFYLRIFITFILLNVTWNIFSPLTAQSLIKSSQTSTYTYIFKISDEEAKKIYSKKKVTLQTNFFHTLIDSFPTGTDYNKELNPGHYLKTFTDKNIQKTEITTVQNLDVFLLNNSHDLIIQLYDLEGQIIRDAAVKVKRKSIKYREDIEAYALKKANKKGLLSVSYEGFTTYYYLDRNYNNSRFKRTSRKVLYGTPLKYVWMPVDYIIKLPVDGAKSIVDGWSQGTVRQTENFFVRLYNRVLCWFDDDYCYSKNRGYKGYLVFNKPKYKPGDTVKFKSFIVNKRGKTHTKTVSVKLYASGKTIPLTTLIPYDKGGYEYQFFLHDSLNLKLDTRNTISLQDKEGNALIYNTFQYEDYELAKNQMQIRLPKNNHYHNKPLEVYIKATDENDLVLQDARVRILRKHKNPTKYYEDNLFIPDTLDYFEKSLEPSSETKIELLDSLFPPADFSYDLIVNLLTSDNELLTQSQTIHYYHHSEKLEARLDNDSIEILFRKNGLSTNRHTKVFGKDNFGNETLLLEGETPMKLKLNPFYSSYYLKSGKEELDYIISNKSSLVQISGNRTKDSIHLSIINPRNLSFNYTTYLKNKQLASAHTNELKISEPLPSLENFQISIQYIWGGKVEVQNIAIPIKENTLNIEVAQPNLVYPGQQSTIELSVTDYKGEPVEGVDITAFGLTKKFGYHPPTLPYLGKNRKGRNLINTFNIDNSKLTKFKREFAAYEYWKKRAGIDSIEYYKFIYPKNEIYQASFFPSDSITQFAPFVFSDGRPLPIHVIYVDQKPVYFSWATIDQPYAFNIDPGYHQIGLRTHNKMITIDSLFFGKNQKLIFSLDEAIVNKSVHIKKEKSTLNKAEQHFLSRYNFPFTNMVNKRIAYLQFGNTVQLLSPTSKYAFPHLAGPVSGKVIYKSLEGVTKEFYHQPNFQYEFEGDLIKLKSYDKSLYPKHLSQYHGVKTSLQDLVLTSGKIKDFYESSLETIRTRQDYFQNPTHTSPGYGKLVVEIEDEENLEELPLNILIIQKEDNEFVRVYPGHTRLFHQLPEGNYQLIFFYSNKKYHTLDTAIIAVNGLNFIRVNKSETLVSDAFSLTIDKIIRDFIQSGKTDKKSRTRNLNQVQNTIQQYFYDEDAILVNGTLVDDTGLPLPGANIIIKGTSIGTQTDFDGNYSILINKGDTLIISYVGFETQEVIPRSNELNIQLEVGAALEQVVVTGYSGRNQPGNLSVTNSDIAQVLAGKASGVNISPGAASDIRIRGVGSLSENAQPLYIINGKIFTGDIATLNHENILSTQVLNGLEATTLYGSRGVDGVVIIELSDESLLKTLQLEDKGADFDSSFYEIVSDASSLRQNFSDAAFWEPTLKTDSQGKVKFDVTFPDDITQWETFYLAMNGNKQSGQKSKSIKSYKPLLSQIAIPRFLIEQDTTYAIGKTLNYSDSEQEVTITFKVNDEVRFSKTTLFENAVIDTLMITAKDSISVTYTLDKADGYFDGELREIPIYLQGMLKRSGQFYAMNTDEEINLSFHPDYGPVTIYAQADVLETLNEEMNHVINYKYLCNEQVASKLKMLLLQRKVADYQGISFKKDRLINKHISYLLKNQKPSGLWGWWKDSQDSYWISLQVLESLALAKKEGYAVKLNTDYLIQEMVWRLETATDFDIIYRTLKIAHLFDTFINYKQYIQRLENSELRNFHERILLTELQQTHGMKYALDSILKNRRTTLFGNVYFSDDENISNILNNNIQNTLLVYRILKADTTDHTAELAKMRDYFFERRQSGSWRNTFESAQIVETIIEDFIVENSNPKPKLMLSGSISETIEEFPFERTVAPDNKIAISKSGDFPIYFTSYQSYWDKNPNPKSDDFEIQTGFENNPDNVLEGGTEVTLQVNVTVKKDAEYVLINVPIPGGCSYAGSQNKNRFESHRENFKNEATIFCEKLPIGQHTFEIKLVPRYSGNYTLNPAKIELMYFPTFNANNAIKKVRIE